MSLFEWSSEFMICFCFRHQLSSLSPAPKRRGHRIIPNEIYIYIFELIVPPTWCLTPEELRIFANLSGVCRFFANFCLPRVYEFMQFDGSILRDDTPTELCNDGIYKASREATLCTQIAAKQPLALSLAQRVRSCYFVFRRVEDSRVVRRYLAGMLHMKNIRKLKFSNSFVGAEHWSVIATLESLEELFFSWCTFLQDPADAGRSKPEERVKVKVPHLQVINCDEDRELVAAIHPQYLRTLVVDSLLFDQVDWLPQSGIIELCFCFRLLFDMIQESYVEHVHILLTQAPPSLETLRLYADFRTAVDQDMVRNMFTDPVWQTLSLRSLKLCVLYDPLRIGNVS